MKKNLGTALLLSACAASAIQAFSIESHPASETHVLWKSLGDTSDSTGRHYIQHIVVSGNTDMKGLAFNQFARKMKMLNPADTLHEIVPGYYLITSPRLTAGADSVVFEIDTRGYLVNCSYAPDGFHRVMHDNTAAPVDLLRERMVDNGTHLAFKMPANPTAQQLYDFNALLGEGRQPGVYDIIPSFNSISLLGGASVTDPVVELDIDSRYAVPGQPRHALISVKDGKAVVKSADERAAKIAARIFKAKVAGPNAGKALPAAELVFSPDFEWRGLMIDIARNFQKPETLIDILNLMADNGLTKLHFHPVDDEAWRIELPSLPELTKIGSRRGWGEDESDHLFQIFTGDGNPDNPEGTSNGYYSREDFIKVLRTAHDLGIDVVTEIESPGHARAAIRAMEARAKAGDPAYRLIQDNDTSRYTSAQSFHDNVMNPALESTYKFMETVFDDLIGIYKEAGVPLTGIHIGGDEVPRGAWNGSDIAKAFMNENGIDTERELHAYFVRRIAGMLAERNIPMYGWQEIALDHGPGYDSEIAPLVGGVNSWSTIIKKGETPVPVKSVMGGYPTILSNVDHFYFDLSYTGHPEEPGLSWGGHVNEFTAFDGYANRLCPAPADAPGKVIGINAHVFAETMRSPDQLLMYLTPKIFGLAERAAHADSTYTVADFNAIIGSKELPALEKRYKANGRGRVHINQPGITVIDEMVVMNSPYVDGGIIRYTTDGTEPDEDSAVYTEPFPAAGIKALRARYYRNSAHSQTTSLNL